jgi:hypothetical protein
MLLVEMQTANRKTPIRAKTAPSCEVDNAQIFVVYVKQTKAKVVSM